MEKLIVTAHCLVTFAHYPMLQSTDLCQGVYELHHSCEMPVRQMCMIVTLSKKTAQHNHKWLQPQVATLEGKGIHA